jgi:hypothetical protein
MNIHYIIMIKSYLYEADPKAGILGIAKGRKE